MSPALDKIPSFDQLPNYKNFTGCAWSVWGSDDQLGTVGMLTDEVVQRAAKEEILTGKSISLNWPINFPFKPLFGRKSPQVKILGRPTGESRDDEIHINTQSGTQWDGLRHYGIVEHGVLYNETPVSSIQLGELNIDPDEIETNRELIKLGIHNWAQHGISSRGILLDLFPHLPFAYDPWSSHGFTVADLEYVAMKQGVKFRPGDILLIRVGFMRRWNEASREERDVLGKDEKEHRFAGIQQSEEMKRFLWDNHFAAIASDQPTIEQWPPVPGEKKLHQTLLGLFGMPMGELFDLEALAAECARTGRYTFFFSSWPLNILGGCASPANAAAYF